VDFGIKGGGLCFSKCDFTHHIIIQINVGTVVASNVDRELKYRVFVRCRTIEQNKEAMAQLHKPPRRIACREQGKVEIDSVFFFCS
jgi:hypothetical protein